MFSVELRDDVYELRTCVPEMHCIIDDILCGSMRVNHAEMALLCLNIMTQVRQIGAEASISNHRVPRSPDVVRSI